MTLQEAFNKAAFTVMPPEAKAAYWATINKLGAGGGIDNSYNH